VVAVAPAAEPVGGIGEPVLVERTREQREDRDRNQRREKRLGAPFEEQPEQQRGGDGEQQPGQRKGANRPADGAVVALEESGRDRQAAQKSERAGKITDKFRGV